MKIYSQEKYLFKIVNESDSGSVIGANLSITSNTLKTNFISNEKGLIEIKLSSESFNIKVSHTAFKNKDLIFTSQNLNKFPEINTIFLTPLQNMLETVNITSKALALTRRHNKIIVNVANSDLLRNATLFDALNLSPGVNVNNNTINLYGKAGVKVTIDGQPLILGGRDLQTYLTTLNTSLIEKIEIISVQGASQDANSSSGVINIVTKKDVDQGNIFLSGGKGSGWKHNMGGTYGRKIKKLNLSVNYSNYSNRGLNSSDSHQYGFDNQTEIYSEGNFPYKAKVHNYGLSGKYQLFENQIFSFGFDGSNVDNRLSGGSTMRLISKDSPTSTIENVNNSKFINDNQKYNFKYEITLDSSKHKLIFNVFHNYYSSNSNAKIENVFNQESDDNERFIENRGTIKINFTNYSVDYGLSFDDKTSLTMGGKLSNIKTNNNIDFRVSNNSLNDLILDPNRSNHFIYEENIFAAYSEFKHVYKKFEAQIGLRAEGTKINGNLLTNQRKFVRSYFDLFPNLNIKYDIDENNYINLSYGRFISRPTYQDMNPFVYYSTPYYYTTGNSELLPEKSNNIELSLSTKSLLYTVGARITPHQINYIDETDGESNITKSTIKNFGKLNNYYISVYSPIKITPWWNAVLNSTLFANIYNGIEDITDVNKLASLNCDLTNTFKISNSVRINLSGDYNSPTLQASTKYKSNYSVNLSASLSMLNNSLNLVVSGRDILNTQNNSFNSKYYRVQTNMNSKWESQQINLSLQYSFGKNVFFTSRQKNSEESRIKN